MKSNCAKGIPSRQAHARPAGSNPEPTPAEVDRHQRAGLEAKADALGQPDLEPEARGEREPHGVTAVVARPVLEPHRAGVDDDHARAEGTERLDASHRAADQAPDLDPVQPDPGRLAARDPDADRGEPGVRGNVGVEQLHPVAGPDGVVDGRAVVRGPVDDHAAVEGAGIRRDGPPGERADLDRPARRRRRRGRVRGRGIDRLRVHRLRRRSRWAVGVRRRRRQVARGRARLRPGSSGAQQRRHQKPSNHRSNLHPQPRSEWDLRHRRLDLGLIDRPPLRAGREGTLQGRPCTTEGPAPGEAWRWPPRSCCSAARILLRRP